MPTGLGLANPELQSGVATCLSCHFFPAAYSTPAMYVAASHTLAEQSLPAISPARTCYYHVKELGIAQQLHGCIVDVHVAELHVGVVLCNTDHHLLPQLAHLQQPQQAAATRSGCKCQPNE